jgi:hypothetical protein
MIEWKFRKLSIGADDEKQNYFAMVRLHKDISDFEASAIDLNISRDQRTWKGTGNAIQRLVQMLHSVHDLVSHPLKDGLISATLKHHFKDPENRDSRN